MWRFYIILLLFYAPYNILVDFMAFYHNFYDYHIHALPGLFINMSILRPPRDVEQHGWLNEQTLLFIVWAGWQEHREVKEDRVVLHLGRAVRLPYCLTFWADGMQNQLVGSAWRGKYLFFLPNTILSLL